MANIRLTITVDDIAATLAVFDQIKVYRSTDGGTLYPELTGVGTRIPLVAGQSVYLFDDVAGDTSYLYKTSFFNSVTSGESSLSDAIQGGTDPLYVSVQDIRDAGLTVAEASDAQVLMLIKTFQGFIERVTRNFFIPRSMTLDVDGRGNTLMQLPFPIIDVTELYVNDDFVNAVPASDYLVYNGRGESGRDDRRNPRIKIKTGDTSIFTGIGSVRRDQLLFEVGEKNQRVVGVFGYTEEDGSTPEPIKYALTKLVLANVSNVMAGGGSSPGGPIIEEETDRHRRKYADPFTGSKAFSATGDTQLDQILAAYRGPWAMRAPRTQFRRLTGGGAGV